MSPGNFAVASDGTRLHYQVRGSGPVRIALTHSLAMTGAFWDPVVDAIGDRGTVLTWDCRGHGASDKPEGPYTVETFADDLSALFDVVGWSDAVCAGASMGGTVTLAFANGHPARATALGLFDTTAKYGDDAPAAWEERGAKARADGLASLIGFQQTRWFSDDFRAANPAVVQRCVDVFCANDVDAYAETCRMLGRADLREALPRIVVPTTILVGEEDYATPVAMAREMHDGIAGSTIEVIPGARHLTPLECAGLVAERLLTLAGRVGA